MSFVVINAVTVSEDRHDEFVERFAARAGTVSQSPGFEAFELLRPGEGGRFLVYTRWVSRDAFAAWRQSADFREGHKDLPAQPISTESEVWTFEAVQAEYAAG